MWCSVVIFEYIEFIGLVTEGVWLEDRGCNFVCVTHAHNHAAPSSGSLAAHAHASSPVHPPLSPHNIQPAQKVKDTRLCDLVRLPCVLLFLLTLQSAKGLCIFDFESCPPAGGVAFAEPRSSRTAVVRNHWPSSETTGGLDCLGRPKIHPSQSFGDITHIGSLGRRGPERVQGTDKERRAPRVESPTERSAGG